MSVIAPENASAEYLVECEPIGDAECRIMTNAAIRFGNRFTCGPATDTALADIQGLRRPFRTPEIFMGNHTIHEWTNDGEPHKAHWMMPNNFITNADSVRSDSHSRKQASAITGAVWAAACAAGVPGPNAQVGIYQGVFDASWLTRLPSPSPGKRPAEQLTALVANSDFARFDNPEQVEAAYAEQPRTHVFEGMNATYGWAYLASRWLGALSKSGLSVLVDLFDSRHGDGRLGVHYDCWYNVTIQLSGKKDWQVGHGLVCPGEGIATYTMRAGDVLVIPHDVPHHVDTPADPGHSRHLIFTIDRREPEQLTAS